MIEDSVFLADECKRALSERGKNAGWLVCCRHHLDDRECLRVVRHICVDRGGQAYRRAPPLLLRWKETS